MVKFTIERMNEVKGHVPFFKLFIDGNCQINDFEEYLKSSTTYYSEAKTVKLYMDSYSNNQKNLLPKTKFKIIKTSIKQTCFEFKSKHLRYYGFIYNNGDMIILKACMNDKSEQDSDINRTVNLVEQYLNTLPKII